MRHRLFKRLVTGGVLVILATATLWLPPGAQAVPITFEFTGTVTSVSSLLAGGPVAVNDSLTGSYTFESTTVGIGSCGGIDPCNYSGAITGLNFTVGSYTHTNTGVAGSNSNVSDNNGGLDLYQPHAFVTGPSINGIALLSFSLSLADFSQIMLSDTLLPTTPPPVPSVLPSFSVFGIAYNSPNVGGGVISGTVTSLTLAPVPEPPTAWLFGLGFGLLALWKVRARRMNHTV